MDANIPRRSVGSRHSVPRIHQYHSRRKELRPQQLAAGVSALITVITGVIIFVWTLTASTGFGSRRSVNASSAANESSFCCAAQVSALRLDVKQDPCVDFRNYVCGPRYRHMREFRWSSWNFSAALAESENVVEIVAGQYLRRLHKWCYLVKEFPVRFATTMSSALKTHAPVSKFMSPSEVMTLMVFLSGMKLWTPIYISLQFVDLRDAIVLTVMANAPVITIREFNKTCPGCVDTVLVTLGELFKMNVSTNDVLQFDYSLESVHNVRCASTVVPILLELLPNISAWDEIIGIAENRTVADIELLCISPIDILKEVFLKLSRRSNQPASILSVMLYDVAALYMEIYRNGDDANMLDVCLDQLRKFSVLWIFLFTEAITSYGRDEHVRNIFTVIRDAVNTSARNGALIHPKDWHLLNDKLGNLQLLLPSDVQVYDVDFPTSPVSYGSGYIQAMLYEILVRQKTKHNSAPFVTPMYRQQRLVTVLNRFVVVSPLAYALLDYRNKKKYLIDVPVVGVAMASEIWRYLLYEEEWSNETLSNIREVFNCFRVSYSSYKVYEHWKPVMYALAMPAVIMGAREESWFKVVYATDDLNVSHGQLFFLRLGDARCDELHAWGHDLNFIVQHTSNFAQTFSCPVGSPMTRGACPLLFLQHVIG